MKRLLLDDELLENDEKMTVAQKVKEFAMPGEGKVKLASVLIPFADRLVSNGSPFLVKSVHPSLPQLYGEDTVILKSSHNLSHPAPSPILPKAKGRLKLLDIDPLEMARQLTIMDFDLYKQIRTIDCLNRAKDQKGKSSVSDRISEIIDHTNRVGFFMLYVS
jgi:son of sevenless